MLRVSRLVFSISRSFSNTSEGLTWWFAVSLCDIALQLLMKEFGLKRNMRVVPLFETLDDLYNAHDQVEALFSNTWYRGHIGGKQEIMIGYSDSSKDAGRLAALWLVISLFEIAHRLVHHYLF